jgi:hypothetical protein
VCVCVVCCVVCVCACVCACASACVLCACARACVRGDCCAGLHHLNSSKALNTQLPMTGRPEPAEGIHVIVCATHLVLLQSPFLHVSSFSSL